MRVARKLQCATQDGDHKRGEDGFDHVPPPKRYIKRSCEASSRLLASSLRPETFVSLQRGISGVVSGCWKPPASRRRWRGAHSRHCLSGGCRSASVSLNKDRSSNAKSPPLPRGAFPFLSSHRVKSHPTAALKARWSRRSCCLLRASRRPFSRRAACRVGRGSV